MPEEQVKEVFDFTNPEIPVMDDKKVDDDPPEADDEDFQKPDDQDKPDDSDKPDDKNEDQEVFENEEEYLSQWRDQGLPEDVKTLNDAMDFAVSAHNKSKSSEQSTQMVERMNNWLSSQGITGGMDALMSGNVNPVQFQPQNQQFNSQNFPQQQNQSTNDSPTMQAVMSNHQKGLIKNDDLGFYQSNANINDQALQSGVFPKLDQHLNYIKTLTNAVQSLSKQVRDNSWRMQPKKIRENFNRPELDNAINGGLAQDYSSAAIYIAQNKYPQLLQKLFGGTTPADNNQHKKLRIGGQKPRKHERSVDVMEKYGKYVSSDGTINNAKLETDFPNRKKQIQVVKEIANAVRPPG